MQHEGGGKKEREGGRRIKTEKASQGGRKQRKKDRRVSRK